MPIKAVCFLYICRGGIGRRSSEQRRIYASRGVVNILMLGANPSRHSKEEKGE